VIGMSVRSQNPRAVFGLALAPWIVAVLPAQDRFSWTELHPSPAPSARSSFGFAADPVGGGHLLFGGSTSPGVEVADTWRWDGVDWRNTGASGPAAREYPGMTTDTARRRVVLFGGADRPVVMPGALTLFGDTWEWDGSAWSERSPAVTPAARNQHALAFHAPTGRVLLFGGALGHYASVLGDTWEWDGAAWLSRSPAVAPPARSAHAMCGDPRRGVVVLFGGSTDVSGPFLGDTWEWDGASWALQSPLHAPAARRGHMMAFDARRGRVVLFGGYDGTLLADCWEWDGRTGCHDPRT
jgi:hypothetical protein